MDKVKIAVFVSGGGTNLQALIDSERSGVIRSGEIALVLSSSHSAYALTRAQNAGIETAVFCKADYPDPIARERAMKECLEARGIELIVLAGFMSVLGKEFTRSYEGRIINVHPALIPSFCGMGMYGLHVHEAALKRGVKVTGATVHFVNEECDGGPIILQKAVEVKEGDTPEILQRRVMEEAEWIILPAATEKVCEQLLSKRTSA